MGPPLVYCLGIVEAAACRCAWRGLGGGLRVLGKALL